MAAERWRNGVIDLQKLGFWILLALGMLIALFGVGVDYIVPGANPGLNLPQILIIAFGLALALCALLLRRQGLYRRLRSSARKNGLRVIAISLITLLCLEIALGLAAFPTWYPSETSEELLELAPWWACDKLGCRFVYEAILEECASGNFADRRCIVNRQGFADDEDFVVDALVEGRFRLLFLGDSFTQGFHASVGSSYVETVERSLPAITVWNAGINGTGTNQAAATFASLGPLFQPHLTVLGFYVNDFDDNLFPADNIALYLDADGSVNFIRHYVLGPSGDPIRVSLTVSQAAYARAGRLPIPNYFERGVGNTRLGSLLLSLRERIESLQTSREVDPRFELAKKRTRESLQSLQQQVDSLESELLVLLIDERQDAAEPLKRFGDAVELMRELGLPYLDTSPFVQTPDDFYGVSNSHWNSAGHEKVGLRLSQCIEAFMYGGSLADCGDVVLP